MSYFSCSSNLRNILNKILLQVLAYRYFSILFLVLSRKDYYSQACLEIPVSPFFYHLEALYHVKEPSVLCQKIFYFGPTTTNILHYCGEFLHICDVHCEYEIQSSIKLLRNFTLRVDFSDTACRIYRAIQFNKHLNIQ